MLSPRQGWRTCAKCTTGKQGSRYSPGATRLGQRQVEPCLVGSSHVTKVPAIRVCCAPPARAPVPPPAARRIQHQQERCTTWCAHTRALSCILGGLRGCVCACACLRWQVPPDDRACCMCRPRAQGWLSARRLSDTGNNRAVARGHRWCAGAGAVGGRSCVAWCVRGAVRCAWIACA